MCSKSDNKRDSVTGSVTCLIWRVLLNTKDYLENYSEQSTGT